MRNTADVTGGKPIAVLLQPISGVSAINPLIERFCPGHHTRLNQSRHKIKNIFHEPSESFRKMPDRPKNVMYTLKELGKEGIQTARSVIRPSILIVVPAVVFCVFYGSKIHY
jgi:hypothetical protein